MSKIIEILLYQLKPGSGEEFFDLMSNVSVPLHEKWGIDVVWHGQSMHDPDGYGLIRCFSDIASMDAVQSAFYASDAWKSGPREAIISRIESASKIVTPMNSAAVNGLRKQGAHRVSQCNED